MYEQGVEDFSWEEDEQENLIDPRARRWEAEWNVLREAAGVE
jgi:hypothetical protein